MAEFVKVASVGDVSPGSGITVEVSDKPIAIFNLAGKFYAIDDSCPHQGGPLGEGEVEGTVVACPWHEWRYDVCTGVNVDDDSCKVATYPIRVEGDDLLVEV